MGIAVFLVILLASPELGVRHVRQPDGSLAPIAFEIPQEPEFFMGGGGLYSVGGDYLKFAQMILHQGRFNGAQVLKPATIARMVKNQIVDLYVCRNIFVLALGCSRAV